MSFFKRIIAFFMSIIAFFAGLFSGGKKPVDPVPVPTNPTENSYYDYAYGADSREILDLVLPENAVGETGLILFIHGGAWIAGNKDQYRSALQSAATLGYAGAAINYRYLSDTVHMDKLMDDVTAALSKIKALAAERNIRLNKALLTGTSAGAHMSLLYAYRYAEVAPITPAAVVSYCGPTDLCNPTFIEQNALGDTAAMIGLLNQIAGISISVQEYTEQNGQYAAWLAALQSYSPLYQVSSACAPTVLGHGMQDTIVPYANATALDEALTAAAVQHDFVIFPNSGHGLDQDADAASQMYNLLIQYAQTYLK